MDKKLQAYLETGIVAN